MGIAGSIGKVAGAALTIGDPIMTFVSARNEGDSIGRAAVKTGIDAVLWGTAPGAMFGLTVAPELIRTGLNSASSIGRQNASAMSRGYKSNFGGNYNISEAGYTMRQRGLNAIQSSRGNISNQLGNEARSYYGATR